MESIGRVLRRTMREGLPPSLPCDVCGEPTQERYFGRPLCCPYDEGGRVVKQCKGILGKQLEAGGLKKGRPPAYPPTGDEIPF